MLLWPPRWPTRTPTSPTSAPASRQEAGRLPGALPLSICVLGSSLAVLFLGSQTLCSADTNITRTAFAETALTPSLRLVPPQGALLRADAVAVLQREEAPDLDEEGQAAKQWHLVLKAEPLARALGAQVRGRCWLIAGCPPFIAGRERPPLLPHEAGQGACRSIAFGM